MEKRVDVFIDYQNAHLVGHGRFCSPQSAKHDCLIHPLKVAERILEVRGTNSVLGSVRVYRGRPDPRKEPNAARYSDLQADEWSKDPRVKVMRRALRYPSDWGTGPNSAKAAEKGIDVALAVDFIDRALSGNFDVGILFSSDTDLIPALELAIARGIQVEVASWAGAKQLRTLNRSTYCHLLDAADFLRVRDSRIYTK